MRRSGWGFGIAGLIVWIAACAAPLVAAFIGAVFGTEAGSGSGTGAWADGTPATPVEGLGTITLHTVAYAAAVAIGAVLAGWPAGRILASRPGGARATIVGMLVLAPILVPAYVVFYTWWQAWPADSALGAWAIRNDQVGMMRRATLVASLVCWSWPIVTWTVAACASATGARRAEMLRLDGAGPWQRALAMVRSDAGGLARGAVLVFLATLGNTTCFDLAQVSSLGNELRALADTGASLRTILAASLPAQVIVILGAAVFWRWMEARGSDDRPGAAPCRGRTWVLAAMIWVVTVAVPLLLLMASFRGLVARGPGPGARFGEFIDLYGSGLLRTAGRAAVTGVAAVVVGMGLVLAADDRRRWVRGLAHLQMIGWLVAALVPATVLAAGLESVYNTNWPSGGEAGSDGATLSTMIYRQPAILVLGHLGRFGIIAALIARRFMRSESARSADLRRLDDVDRGVSVFVIRPGTAVAGAVAVAALVAVAAFGEVPLTARVHPPGSDPTAVSLLNAMHYQRPMTVLFAVAVIIAAATLIAGSTTALLQMVGHSRRTTRTMMFLAVVLTGLTMTMTLTGCTGGSNDGKAPLDTTNVFGVNGTALGQFSYPRCVAADVDRQRVYVIDKTARVQCFDLDGAPQSQWRMPAKEKGKPTGVSVAPDGRVFVADTHYHRIIAFTPDGDELMRFGQYGEAPGEFIYPTDVAFGPEGTLYVAEYGGHDRIQVFSAEGVFLFEFGCFGSEPGCFDRPQAIAFNHDRTELYIADSCNHRIVVVDPNGRTIRRFGTAGFDIGELHYPYGIECLEDDTLLVTEFGNSRLQRFAPDGTSLGLFGRMGAGAGELRYPWGTASADDSLFVLDSGNNRVQVMPTP